MTPPDVSVCNCDEIDQPHIHFMGADGSHWIASGQRPHGEQGVMLS